MASISSGFSARYLKHGRYIAHLPPQDWQSCRCGPPEKKKKSGPTFLEDVPVSSSPRDFSGVRFAQLRVKKRSTWHVPP